jgi:signal transduction histidine kinase
MADDKLLFRISTGLKNIIGRDLITDDYVAVFELVKNSFDAHAKTVTITFKPNKIIIKDDGKGMNLDDIKDKWLFVAYSAKKEGVEDKDLKRKEFDTYRDKIQIKQYYAGAKGIGRFSCDRLGDELTLTTKSASANSSIEQIKVKWKAFDVDSTQDFQTIEVEHKTIERPYPGELKKFKHGTILEISEIGPPWTRKKKIDLKKSLERLINPLNTTEGQDNNSKNDNFKIVIKDETEKEADEAATHPRDKVNGEVKNFVFETLNLRTTYVLTDINETGETITITLRDRGTLVYKINKPNNTSPKLRNIRFHLFFLNKIAKSNFTRLMGIQPVNFGSVFVYKNGFRVAPYGDYLDDSFGLDTRKGQKFERLGTRDLIGRIEINGDNPHFREVSSRNGGLVKNEYYTAMYDSFIKNCVEKLEGYVRKVSRKVSDDNDRLDVSALENILSKSALLELISEEVSSQGTELEDIDKDFVNLKTKELIKQASENDIKNLKVIAKKFGDSGYSDIAVQTQNEYIKVKELEEQLRKEEEEKQRLEEQLREEEEARRKLEEQLEIERQKNTYLTATRRDLDDDANGLIHGIKINTVKINESIENLIRKITSGNFSAKDFLKELSNIKFYSDRAFKLSKLITRANFKSDRDKHTIDVVKYISQYLSFYADIYEQSRLSFDVIENGTSFYKKVSVLDLSIIIDNLISNSEKWDAKKILVEMSNDDSGKLEILFSDDGQGVVKKYLEDPRQIFELGVTETNGSGIGLHTVKERLKTMNAEISFAGNGEKLKGATFQIVFNK